MTRFAMGHGFPVAAAFWTLLAWGAVGPAPARAQAALIYRKTGNLRAVQLLLGHTKLESTVRYLGVDVDDALEISTGIDL